MKVIDPGHAYRLNGNSLEFIKRSEGKLIHDGTTNEEVLEVLLDRMEYLNKRFPCQENEDAIYFMFKALKRLNDLVHARIAQGVETLDMPHISHEQDHLPD